MVCVENCMYVPLLCVEPGQYEVIALNADNRHVYTRLNGDRLPAGLHKALKRYHSPEGVTDADRALASEVLQQYANLQLDSDVMRCKLYSMLLPAYAILGDREAFDQLLGTVRSILPLIRAEQSRSLLLVTLYGCTNAVWIMNRPMPRLIRGAGSSRSRRARLQLLRRLDDYDCWLSHHTGSNG